MNLKEVRRVKALEEKAKAEETASENNVDANEERAAVEKGIKENQNKEHKEEASGTSSFSDSDTELSDSENNNGESKVELSMNSKNKCETSIKDENDRKNEEECDHKTTTKLMGTDTDLKSKVFRNDSLEEHENCSLNPRSNNQSQTIGVDEPPKTLIEVIESDNKLNNSISGEAVESIFGRGSTKKEEQLKSIIKIKVNDEDAESQSEREEDSLPLQETSSGLTEVFTRKFKSEQLEEIKNENPQIEEYVDDDDVDVKMNFFRRPKMLIEEILSDEDDSEESLTSTPASKNVKTKESDAKNIGVFQVESSENLTISEFLHKSEQYNNENKPSPIKRKSDDQFVEETDQPNKLIKMLSDENLHCHSKICDESFNKKCLNPLSDTFISSNKDSNSTGYIKLERKQTMITLTDWQRLLEINPDDNENKSGSVNEINELEVKESKIKSMKFKDVMIYRGVSDEDSDESIHADFLERYYEDKSLKHGKTNDMFSSLPDLTSTSFYTNGHRKTPHQFTSAPDIIDLSNSELCNETNTYISKAAKDIATPCVIGDYKRDEESGAINETDMMCMTNCKIKMDNAQKESPEIRDMTKSETDESKIEDTDNRVITETDPQVIRFVNRSLELQIASSQNNNLEE